MGASEKHDAAWHGWRCTLMGCPTPRLAMHHHHYFRGHLDFRHPCRCDQGETR